MTVNTDIMGLLFDVLTYLKIEYIIAPYEADSQIAYMIKNNLCDTVISEDSDLLVYKCKSVIYKLDSTGNCSHIDISVL